MDELDSVSTAVLKLSMSCKTGIPRARDIAPPSSSLAGGRLTEQPSPREKRIVELYRELSVLKRKLLEVEIDPSDRVVAQYASLPLAELKVKAERARELADIHALTISGPLLPVSLLRAVVDGDALSGYSGTLDQSVGMTMELHENMSRLKNRLMQLQNDNKALHTRNRNTTAKIVDIARQRRIRQRRSIKPEEKAKLKTLNDSISETNAKIMTLKSVILGITLASGLDWGADEELRQIVLNSSTIDEPDSMDDFDLLDEDDLDAI